MTTTSDESALLRAIAAHPDEDLPRLMYADWLDENAGECPQCEGTGWEHVADSAGDMDDQPCRKCRGAGVDFRRERAEFIRLQIALAGLDSELPACVACNGTKRVTVMAYPEAASDPEPHEVETDCTACICPVKYVKTGTNRNATQSRVLRLWHGGVADNFVTGDVNANLYAPSPDFAERHPVLVVTRGFAETLYLPTLADLCERDQFECVQCRGHGYIWQMPPMERIFVIDSRDKRPLPEPARIQCDACHGTRYTIGDYTGKPTQLALDTMRAHPTITRVVVGDRRPWHAFDASMESVYQIVAGDFSDHTGERISREIFAEVAKLGIGKVRENSERGVIEFASQQAALDALAVAAGQWLRQEAGILTRQ